MSTPVLPGSSRALYRNLLVQAASEGAVLLGRVLAQARQSMRDDANRMKGLLERDHLELSVKLLDLHAPTLCEQYPKALEEAFNRHHVPEARLGVVSTQGLRLDQLELMNESQVQERVELARALQHVLLVADAALMTLNTYVCALRGLERVAAERNPLRPDAYVAAMQVLMSGMNVPTLVRMAWMQHVSGPLGIALSVAYKAWSAQLHAQGVQAATFAVLRAPERAAPERAPDERRGREVWSPHQRETVLTLGRLRRLMAGELEGAPLNAKEVFARQFENQFESEHVPDASETGFAHTVPAAFVALQEMQQVDQVVQRLTQRPVAMPSQTDSLRAAPSVRDQLRSQAHGLGQSLGLEVVSLMVENLAQDTRLLEPVQRIIERLEPALLRLVLVDARFFLDKQHPARSLLQAVAQRGLAFGSTDDPLFNAFLLSLQRFVSPLSGMQIENAEPFAHALSGLVRLWDDASARADLPTQIDSAVAALQYAEARNLLADKMVVDMGSIAELHHVPQSVVDFLFGPWAQVMASAQLNDSLRADDPGDYKALVYTLLWSAQPELTRKNISQLTKVVPRLLSSLREGLRLIDYPSTKTSAFFDLLMKLHQQAFRPATTGAPAALARTGLAQTLHGDQDHWVAPAEAKASGFMEMPEDLVPVPAPAVGPVGPELAGQTEAALNSLSVGTWVELKVNAAWTRTQLSWVSPQRTMYLFTTVQGKTQSMTQRMLERLLGLGTLRVLSDQPMVDSALDAVVHTAMLNSLDLRTG